MAQAGDAQERVWTVPNLLSLTRIALIPFFCAAYWRGHTVLAVCLVALSALTDVADGRIARRFGAVTRVGKALDPAADKLTLVALAVCLAMGGAQLWPLVAVLVVKEGIMAALCAVYLRRGGRLHSARWFGKVTTALLYGTLLTVMLFPRIPGAVVSAMQAVACGCVLACGVLYVRAYRSA